MESIMEFLGADDAAATVETALSEQPSPPTSPPMDMHCAMAIRARLPLPLSGEEPKQAAAAARGSRAPSSDGRLVSVALVICAFFTMAGLLTLLTARMRNAEPIAIEYARPETATRANETAFEVACPSGWTRGGSGSCFRASANLAAHAECTEECSAGGERASLACIDTVEERVLLSTLLCSGRQAWVGGYEGPFGWQSANARCADSRTVPSGERRHEAAPQHAAHETARCGFLDSTGRLGEEACDWAGLPCLCELGADELPEYRQAMEAAAQARERRAANLRVWAATIYSAAVALPLIMDKRMLQMLPIERFSGAKSSASSQSVSWLELMRNVGPHLGWALLVLGWGPFICQASVGSWDAAGLGSWCAYTPMGPWGALILIESGHAGSYHQLALIYCALFIIIGLLMAKSLVSELWTHMAAEADAPTPDALGSTSYFGNMQLSMYSITLIAFGLASAALNTWFSLYVLSSIRRQEAPSDLYWRLTFSGVMITGVCGMALFIGCLVKMHDDAMATLQHPYFPGTLATSLAWLASSGFYHTSSLKKYCFGRLSNGLSEKVS